MHILSPVFNKKDINIYRVSKIMATVVNQCLDTVRDKSREKKQKLKKIAGTQSVVWSRSFESI